MKKILFLIAILGFFSPVLSQAQRSQTLQLQYPTRPLATTEVKEIPIYFPKFFVKVTAPNGGEVITLDPSKLTTVSFNYGGPFNKSSGNYSHRFELWLNGQLLGETATIKFPLNPNKTSVNNYGHKPGTYFAKNAQGFLEQRVAEPGGGYKFRVVISEAITPAGQPTYYKELADDFSDGDFIYSALEKPTLKLIKAAPITTTVIYPNGGESIPLDDQLININFKYSGGFNQAKGGNYKYRIELWRNGQKLGNISNFDNFPLNISKTTVSFGTKPGVYWVPNPATGKDQKVAEAGGGYKYRVVLMEAITPPGQPTYYQELAEDLSDQPFSFIKKKLLPIKPSGWTKIRNFFARSSR